MLKSPLNKEHFSWSIRDETLFKSQTEWIIPCIHEGVILFL